MPDLVKTTKYEATPIEPDDDRPTIGSWYWVKEPKHQDNFDREKQWLACVVEIGTNYAKFQGVRFDERISLDDIHERCVLEHDPHAFIDFKVGQHKSAVRQLMGEIQRVCHKLGVPYRQALAEAEAETSALAVVHGVGDAKSYQKSLVKAKDKTLPELFKKVKSEHEEMARWMRADLIPAEADLEQAKGVTKLIENKIHTVELYAGLTEKLIQVRTGDPAPGTTKIHLMQRRHYMDEECLAVYEAGGMDFQDLEAFDKWMAKDDNMFRILPHPRCIVAMRIRRNAKDYDHGEPNTLANFIRFQSWNEANEKTFLYIRNGRQLWRMSTSIDFGENLFPNRVDSDLLGDNELWVRPMDSDWHDKFITSREYADRKAKWQQQRNKYAREVWDWHNAGKPTGKWYNHKRKNIHGEPWSEHGQPHKFIHDDWSYYEQVTPESLYYDDAMKRIAKAAFEQNRVAVIIQGLLDRSMCLQPHPPWRIWTKEGFDLGIELVYDTSRGLTQGEAVDWEGYWNQLNKSIRPGCVTIGQYGQWEKDMAAKYGYKWDRWEFDHLTGRGPKSVDKVVSMKRNGMCEFRFARERKRGRWITDPERPYKQIWDDSDIEMKWWCHRSKLFCVDAYTPGDFHMFFDDPRTRAEYLKWAPFLLAAEDWHAKRRTAPDEDTSENDE